MKLTKYACLTITLNAAPNKTVIPPLVFIFTSGHREINQAAYEGGCTEKPQNLTVAQPVNKLAFYRSPRSSSLEVIT
jgi:hypothetical protein